VRLAGFACFLTAALVLAGCGGSKSSTPTTTVTTTPAGGSKTIQQLLASPGADVALVSGTSEYSPGPIRVSFLVVRHDGSTVSSPRARVWIATGLKDVPYEQAAATLEPIGVPGRSQLALGGAGSIFVVHLHAPKPGRYWVLAEPVGASKPIQALGNVDVKASTSEPAVGARALRSQTPTIASTHGNFRLLTTKSPPDRDLLRYSVADSIAAHKPFLLVFATPKFCTSRTCGPVVDVVEAAKKRLAGGDVRFIHVEIFKGNDPAKGYNQWVKEWKLPTEPWIFLVGADGRIKAKFEGSVSVAELVAAVRTLL
jgi:hypothetical protein